MPKLMQDQKQREEEKKKAGHNTPIINHYMFVPDFIYSLYYFNKPSQKHWTVVMSAGIWRTPIIDEE